MRTKRGKLGTRGYMLSEVLALATIATTMGSVAAIDVGKALSHAHSLSALSSVSSILASARLQAIMRSTPIVVEISIEPLPSRRISLRTFEDNSGDFSLGTYVKPGNPTPINERILSDFAVDSSFHLWVKGGAKDDVTDAARFNTYTGKQALSQRIVFLPDGGMAAPEASDSGTPTATAGRGLYLADTRGKDFYRVTFATTLIARARVDKYSSAAGGYVPENRIW